MSVLLLTQLLLVMWTGVATSGDYGEETPQGSLILTVGMQDDMYAGNYLRNLNRWSMGRLDPVYDQVGKFDPETEAPIPYLLKGVDADDSGTFDLDEYGVYVKSGGSPYQVTAYYDFNGVYSHDGIQMTIHDLLFSYHLWALHPKKGELDVLKDKDNLPGSNYTASRWLNVWPVADVWDPAIPLGPDASLTFALHFNQQAPYSGFVRHTLNSVVIMPRHVWQGTGRVCLDATSGICNTWKSNIHGEFGYAYDDVTRNGIPTADPSSFVYADAESWLPEDDEVIGTGPFEFDDWDPGVHRNLWLTRFEDYHVEAYDCWRVGDPPVCQGSFYAYLHKPFVDVIHIRLYKTIGAMVFALQYDEIQFVGSSIGPEFVPILQADPTVALVGTASRGFGHIGYNMRDWPFGYPFNDPALGDDGLWLRRAIAHTVDRELVRNVLFQNYSFVADQPVHPADVRWYNSSVPDYPFDLDAARVILDDHYTIGGFGLGWGPNGYRNLLWIGDDQIDIYCVQADYDPIQTSACHLIAENMRDIGVNANPKLVPYQDLTYKLEVHSADMWFHENFIYTEPSEHYHGSFYTSNAQNGSNYAGFQNSTFDSVIAQARAELDVDAQASLIKQASGILVDNLPLDPVFFRTNLEAYRQDRFINWTVGPGSSIYCKSYWSWIGVRPPEELSVDIQFPYGSTVNEGETLLFDLLVTNATTGQPVDDAIVTISCDPAGPVILPSGGTTVDGSIGLISFTAPEFDFDTYFTITAIANNSLYVASDSALILVMNTDVQPRPPALQDVHLSLGSPENVTLQWEFSLDDGQGNMSVVRYDIHRGTTFDSLGDNYTLHGSVANGTWEYVDIGAGEGDPSDYFYRVCAVDGGNNSTCSIKQGGKFTRSLSQGPNLVSVPLLQSVELIQLVFQTVEYRRAWTYDSREWTSYAKGFPYWTLELVDHTMGVWINVTTDCNLTVAGVVPARTEIQLDRGWNLVSFPSFSSHTVADLKAETGATRVEGFDLAPPYFLRVLTDGDVLQAGYGYWVKIDAPVVWVVGNG